ncbi:hypothetical protein HanPI659440_Chr08g0302431 [Helianthus annuus]|nr:hypothetical protein HanPI659440_Chr08g0302431 [Helianthus annuus]
MLRRTMRCSRKALYSKTKLLMSSAQTSPSRSPPTSLPSLIESFVACRNLGAHPKGTSDPRPLADLLRKRLMYSSFPKDM